MNGLWVYKTISDVVYNLKTCGIKSMVTIIQQTGNGRLVKVFTKASQHCQEIIK